MATLDDAYNIEYFGFGNFIVFFFNRPRVIHIIELKQHDDLFHMNRHEVPVFTVEVNFFIKPFRSN